MPLIVVSLITHRTQMPISPEDYEFHGQGACLPSSRSPQLLSESDTYKVLSKNL